jgi:uncharacterized OB-fold protein
MTPSLLPPQERSRAMRGLTAAAAQGRFELQVCQECTAVQYPPRDACHRCLSVHLSWQLQSGEGQLIAVTTLHHSHHPYFQQRLPWRIGMIRLDAGPTLIAHLQADLGPAPQRVVVQARLDSGGEAALFALPAAG